MVIWALTQHYFKDWSMGGIIQAASVAAKKNALVVVHNELDQPIGMVIAEPVDNQQVLYVHHLVVTDARAFKQIAERFEHDWKGYAIEYTRLGLRDPHALRSRSLSVARTTKLINKLLTYGTRSS